MQGRTSQGVTEEVSKWKGSPSSRIGRLSLATMPVLPKWPTHPRQNPSRLRQAHPKCHMNPRPQNNPERNNEGVRLTLPHSSSLQSCGDRDRVGLARDRRGARASGVQSPEPTLTATWASAPAHQAPTAGVASAVHGFSVGPWCHRAQRQSCLWP